MNAGGVTSAIHVTVLDALDKLPQISDAKKVLVCERLQPLLITWPVVVVKKGEPQSSDAVAVPSAALMVVTAGLQPRFVELPLIVNTGGVRSDIATTVLVRFDTLPHLSVAVKVLV